MTRLARLSRLAPLVAAVALSMGCQEPAGLEGTDAPSVEPPAPSGRAEASVDARAPEPVEAGAAPAVASADAAPVLIWGLDADGGAYSWWLERDGLGGWDVIEGEGIYLATADALWRWTTVVEELPLGMDCHRLDLGEEPSFGDTGRTGSGARALLERVGGQERQVVIEPDSAEALQVADYAEGVTLEGSLGPQLFLHRSSWAYSCGAHGGEVHSFLVFDAEAREPAHPWTADATVALADRLRPAAWDALGQEMPFADGPGDLSLTLHRPVFEADGTLALEHQLTVGTCYACSDGNWDSYTVSTHVRDRALPEALAPLADYPTDAVRWLGEQVEGLEVRGLSQPSPEQRPLFEEQQVPGC